MGIEAEVGFSHVKQESVVCWRMDTFWKQTYKKTSSYFAIPMAMAFLNRPNCNENPYVHFGNYLLKDSMQKLRPDCILGSC